MLKDPEQASSYNDIKEIIGNLKEQMATEQAELDSLREKEKGSGQIDSGAGEKKKEEKKEGEDSSDYDSESDGPTNLFQQNAMPDDMLTAPEFTLETNIKPEKKVLAEADNFFKAPRNLYYGEIEDIEGCMFQFLIDKQWVPKCCLARTNATFMQVAMRQTPNDQVKMAGASACKVNDLVTIQVEVGDALH